jgi:hypothetical protein
MANRHSHKKLRAEIRARMARTGESHQQAREWLTREWLTRARSLAPELQLTGLDVIEFSYFGKPAMLATWCTYGVPIAMMVSEAAGRPLLGKSFTWFDTRGRR